MAIRIRGGRVIDPASGLDAVTDVFIDNGAIVALGRGPRSFHAEWVVDAKGLVVCPGFVELGAHLREPGFEQKATIASEARAAVASGFTTICCTPDTDPILDTPAVAEHINQRASKTRAARVTYLGALTVGLDGKVLAAMQALKDAGCVGVTNLGRAIIDTTVLKHALAYAASCGLTVFLQPEDYWLGHQGHMHEGPTSTRLGIPGIPAAAETIAVHRDLTLVAETGVRAHFCRLSSAASLKLIADARRSGLPVTADTSILNLSFTDADIGGYDANLHLRSPLRSSRDRSVLGQGVKRRVLDAIAAYHEPHDADAKAAPFALTEPGASTFDTFLPALLRLVAEDTFDLSTAIAAVSQAPSRILGLTSGTLAVGAPADICIFDPRMTWSVNAASLTSAGKNNPFIGQTMTGKVVMALVDGRVVHDGLQPG